MGESISILDRRSGTRSARADRLCGGEMLAVLSASGAFGFAGSVFYLLPKFLVEELGTRPASIGLVTAAYGAATVAACPLIASWIDRVPRVWLIRAGACLMVVSSLGFLRVDHVGALVVFLRAIQGVAFAAVFTATSALVADLAPAARLSEALGLAGASMLIMNAVAPAVVEPLAARYGWKPAFLLAAAAAVAALVASQLVTSDVPAERRGVNGARADGPPIGRTYALHYGTITAAVGAAFGVMFTYHQPFALQLGRANVRGFFVAYCVAALAARLSLGRLSDRLGRFRVAVVAINLYTLVVLATAGLRPGLLEGIGALLGLAHGMFFPAFNALAISAAPPSARGKRLSLFTGAFYGGFAGGVLAFGIVAEAAGYPTVFAATAALTFAASALLVFSRAFLTDEATATIAHPMEGHGRANEISCASTGSS